MQIAFNQTYPDRGPLYAPDTGGGPGGETLSAADTEALIRIMADAAPLRHDARLWRLTLMEKMAELLGAVAAAACILKNQGDWPMVVSLFEWGFKQDAARQAFMKEFNVSPFRDVFSRRALENLARGTTSTFTAYRRQLVDDATWHADPHQHYRQPAGIDDCLLSLRRATDRITAYALVFFRPAAGVGPGVHAPAGNPARFDTRDRLLLHALHEGLSPVYLAEESTTKLNRASELPPRLRQTLECLLAGDTERQVALKMSLSVHTVHDYVKALYIHFGVSSRGELLSKWIQTSGQVPHTRSERE